MSILERQCYNCFAQRQDMEGPCPLCGYDHGENAAKYPVALKGGSILNGQYIVGRVLGQGGFGITYLALDHQLKLKVAIKEYMPDGMATRLPGTTLVSVYAGEKQENFGYGSERFLDEARVLARFIGNRNIAGVKSYFNENNTSYFVMDYVEGISFKSYIHNNGGKVGYQDALRVLVPVLRALCAVHREGFIHRDVTPDNIYISKDGEIKLLDFGSARYSLGDKSKSLDVILKAGYAPKEQYIRRGKQGPYTDVYSIAACFYASVTGYLPPESLERMEEDDLVEISARGIRIPSWLDAAVMKGLELRAEDRFQSAEEFLEAIEAGQRSEASPAGQHGQGVESIPAAGFAPPVQPETILGVSGDPGQGVSQTAQAPAFRAPVSQASISQAQASYAQPVSAMPQEAASEKAQPEPAQKRAIAALIGRNKALIAGIAAAFVLFVVAGMMILGNMGGSAGGDAEPDPVQRGGNAAPAATDTDPPEEAPARGMVDFIFYQNRANLHDALSEIGPKAELAITAQGFNLGEHESFEVMIRMSEAAGEPLLVFETATRELASYAICTTYTHPQIAPYRMLAYNMDDEVSGAVFDMLVEALTNDSIFITDREIVRYNMYGKFASSLGGNQLMTTKDGWKYYINYNDFFKLSRISEDRTETVTLCEDEAGFMKYSGSWVYYCNKTASGALYKIRDDGTDRTLISDENVRWINVLDNWVYYYAINEGICKIATDGEDRSLLIANDELGFFGGFILCEIGDGSKLFFIDKEGIWMANLDGTGRIKLWSGRASGFDSDGAFLYFSNIDDGYNLYQIDLDTMAEAELICEDICRNLIYADQGIYYRSGNDNNVYKVGAYGLNRQMIGEDASAARQAEAAGESTRGNVPGNAANGGLAAYDARTEMIYYAHRGDSYKIYAADPTGLYDYPINYENSWNINIYEDGYLYYTNDRDKNTIYRLDSGGGVPEKLNGAPSNCVCVVDDRIYYINRNTETIYSMNLDGSGDRELCSYQAKEMCVLDDYIVFINMSENMLPYAMGRDGSNLRRVGSYGARDLCAWGKYAYYSYTGDFSGIRAIDLSASDDDGDTLFYQGFCDELNAFDGYVYFSHAAIGEDDQEGIYRRKVGSEEAAAELIVAAHECWNISIAGDYLYYRINADKQGDQALYRVRKEGGHNPAKIG